MKVLKNKFVILVACCSIFAQQANPNLSREITFPNLDNYLTIIGDFHSHSVFSDGSVWPDIRIEEAIKDGLDIFAVTEHLERQVNKNDIPHPDRNRSFDLAKQFYQKKDLSVFRMWELYNQPFNPKELIIINGAEISREFPYGHNNAIFLKDANKLNTFNVSDAFEAAMSQEAFIFWNHSWRGQKPSATVSLTEFHKDLISKGYLHGIEIVNKDNFSEDALRIALDYNLTIMANSDIHGIIDWTYNLKEGGHRPVTIIFSNQKNEKSIKEALFNRQTVVWHNNTLVGRNEWLLPLIEKSILIDSISLSEKGGVVNVFLSNKSDTKFILKNISKFDFFNDSNIVEIQPQSSAKVSIITRGEEKIDLQFEVLNAIYAPRMHPILEMKVR